MQDCATNIPPPSQRKLLTEKITGPVTKLQEMGVVHEDVSQVSTAAAAHCGILHWCTVALSGALTGAKPVADSKRYSLTPQ